MKKMLILAGTLFFSTPCFAQEADNRSLAVSNFASSMPAALKDDIKRRLLETGKSEQLVDKIIGNAIHLYASCAITTLLDQARSQGISEDTVLKIFARKPVSAAEERESDHFDAAAFKERLGICRSELSANLGLEII